VDRVGRSPMGFERARMRIIHRLACINCNWANTRRLVRVNMPWPKGVFIWVITSDITCMAASEPDNR
jgi:hypothetical protein